MHAVRMPAIAGVAAGLALLAPEARAQSAVACADLAKLSSSFATITTTRVAAAAGVPAYCSLNGTFLRRTGALGLPYAINFRLNLPDNWNHRFYFQGGGGTDGSVPTATGNTSPDGQPNRLAQGYAIAADDSGHDNTADYLASAGGTAAFGTDPEARIDFGYLAIGLVTPITKFLTALYYHGLPAYSYFDGCSNGGREAFEVTQRFPNMFDGVLAGDPGFDLPKAAVAEAWNDQALAAAATSLDANGIPYLPSALSPSDLTLAASAVTEACDTLDGVADGIVSNPAACSDKVVRPVLAQLQCHGAKTASCLEQKQITALEAIYGGVHNSAGTPLYASFQWDPGLTGFTSLTLWDIGYPAATPPVNDSLNITLGGGALPLIFVSPPAVTPLSGLASYMLSFNFDTDAPKIYANVPPFAPPMDVIAADQEDLRPFVSHGGKLLMYQGDSDPVFSPHDTARWLDAVQGGAPTASFARFFLVPGMGHCNAGPSTSAFDAFGTLVNWVEHGQAPASIVATAPAGTPWPGRTRPLCAYPSYAQYQGGNIEDAASFRCVPGARISANQ